jgi:hypothetical protein
MMVLPINGDLGALQWWVQSNVPAVYDDSLSYYELLSKVIAQLNGNTDFTNGVKDTLNDLINLVNSSKWVDEGKIGDEQISTRTLEDGSVTLDKLDPALQAQPTNSVGIQAKLYAIDSFLSQLPDQSYIADKAKKTDLTALQTQINAIPSGTPKGVYPSLSDLQTAFPTGTTGIYIVSSDGKWYFWNGTAWTAGGTYQSTGIANKSIKPIQLSDDAAKAFSVSKSPFTYNADRFILPVFEIGALFGDGTNAANAQKIRSDFFTSDKDITVKLLDPTYSFSVFKYNASNNSFVSYVNYSSDTVLTGTNGYTYRISIYKKVLENVVSVDTYVNSVAIVTGDNFITQSVADVQTIKSRLDLNGLMKVLTPSGSIGSLYGNDGTDAVNAQKVRTDYFQPLNNFTISLNNESFNFQLLSYDANKVFKSVSAPVTTGSLKTNVTPGYFYRLVISKDVAENVVSVSDYLNAVTITDGDKQTNVKRFHTFSILGDSYSSFAGYMADSKALTWFPAAQNSHPDNDVNDVTQTWWYQFANSYGARMVANDSYSGSTVSYDGYGAGTTDGKDTSFISRRTMVGQSELILVYGGTNDAWNSVPLGNYKYSDWTETDFQYFSPSLAYLFDRLQRENVGAKIVMMLNDSTVIGQSYVTAIQTVCNHYNIPYVTVSNLTTVNSHPNSVGMKQISDQLISLMNTLTL